MKVKIEIKKDIEGTPFKKGNILEVSESNAKGMVTNGEATYAKADSKVTTSEVLNKQADEKKKVLARRAKIAAEQAGVEIPELEEAKS